MSRPISPRIDLTPYYSTDQIPQIWTLLQQLLLISLQLKMDGKSQHWAVLFGQTQVGVETQACLES